MWLLCISPNVQTKIQNKRTNKKNFVNLLFKKSDVFFDKFIEGEINVAYNATNKIINQAKYTLVCLLCNTSGTCNNFLKLANFCFCNCYAFSSSKLINIYIYIYTF